MDVKGRTALYSRLEHASDVYSRAEIEAFRASGAWTNLLLTDLLDQHARRVPNDTAVVDETSRISWGQLASRANRLAASLVDLGLRPGDFVGVQLPNRIEFVEVYLAIMRAGLRALPMMTIYRERDVVFMLNTCGARAYIAMDSHRSFDFVEMAQRVCNQVETLESVIILGEADQGMVSYESMMWGPDVKSESFAHLRPDPDGLSKVGFTSGTTGFPKGVAHTHNTDMVPPMLTARALGLNAATPIWMPSPICHATGLAFGVYDSLLCGAKLVLQDVWDPERGLDLIAREKATFTVSATPFIAGMVEAYRPGRHDISSFKYFASGGARIPTSLVERARDELDVWLLRVFGQAEAPLHTLNLPSHPWEKLLTRDGRPFDGVSVRIVDPADRSSAVPSGEVGEYSTWGPHVFLGYYGNPEASWEAKDSDRWYYSGDLCVTDDEGFVLYVDRIKDIVNRGGVKISALEVENLLAGHPGVQAVAIVAIPDERLGERACAFIVARDSRGVTLESLCDYLDANGVTKQKWPEYLRVVDSLPYTSTGKVRKNILRDSISEQSK